MNPLEFIMQGNLNRFSLMVSKESLLQLNCNDTWYASFEDSIPNNLKNFTRIYSNDPKWFVLNIGKEIDYMSFIENTFHEFRMAIMLSERSPFVTVAFCNYNPENGDVANERLEGFNNFYQAQSYINCGCSHKVPHVHLSKIDREKQIWKCKGCGVQGTYDEITRTSCTANYKPCEFCGQAPLCSPICSMMVVLTKDKL